MFSSIDWSDFIFPTLRANTRENKIMRMRNVFGLRLRFGSHCFVVARWKAKTFKRIKDNIRYSSFLSSMNIVEKSHATNRSIESQFACLSSYPVHCTQRCSKQRKDEHKRVKLRCQQRYNKDENINKNSASACLLATLPLYVIMNSGADSLRRNSKRRTSIFCTHGASPFI